MDKTEEILNTDMYGRLSKILANSYIMKDILLTFDLMLISIKALREQQFKINAEMKVRVDTIENTFMFHEFILRELSSTGKLNEIADKFEAEYGAVIVRKNEVVH